MTEPNMGAVTNQAQIRRNIDQLLEVFHSCISGKYFKYSTPSQILRILPIFCEPTAYMNIFLLFSDELLTRSLTYTHEKSKSVRVTLGDLGAGTTVNYLAFTVR
jgi:hypothetical protein